MTKQEALMSSTERPQPQGTIVPTARAPQPIDPNIVIGHVHLRTADIDRVRAFYVDVLGFDVVLEARACQGGAPPATSYSSPLGGTTTISALTRGSRLVAGHSPTV